VSGAPSSSTRTDSVSPARSEDGSRSGTISSGCPTTRANARGPFAPTSTSAFAYFAYRRVTLSVGSTPSRS
jgi:hypothetical protein